MTHAIKQSGPEVKLDDRDLRARKAVKNFRTMQPMLSAFARVLTRNPKIRVEMSTTSNGQTDGHKIFYRPPIELGDLGDHVRKLCDKRDENMIQRCPTCKLREGVLAVIFHEISHIAYDSFAPLSEADRKRALDEAIKANGSKYAKALEKKARELNAYNSISHLVSKYLPFIVNCLEDARIEWASATARPGTRNMYVANVRKVFSEGYDGPDNKTIKWSEAPLDSQASIGLYVKAGDYGDYANWFQPQVVAALNDPVITDLCDQVKSAKKVADVWSISFPALARMRELGFFRDDYQPEEEEPEEEPSENPGSDGDDSQESESSDDADGNEGGSSSASSDSASSDDADDSDGRSEDSDSSEPSSGSSDVDSGESDDKAASGNGENPSESPGSESSTGGQESEVDDTANEAETDQDTSADDRETSSSDSPDSSCGSDPEERNEDSDSNSSTEQVDDDPSVDQGEPGSDDGTEANDDGADEGSPGEGATGQPGDSTESRRQHGTEVEEDEDTEGSAEASDSSQEVGRDGPGSDNDGASHLDGDPSFGDADELGEDNNLADADSDPNVHDAGDHERGGQDPGEVESASSDDFGDSDLQDTDDSDEVVQPVDGVDEESASPEEDRGDREGDGLEELDTGADDGTGGVEVVNDLPHGTPEDNRDAILKFLGHEDKPDSVEIQADNSAVEKALVQGMYFETPSQNIYGVKEHYYGKPEIDSGINLSSAWDENSFYDYNRYDTGRSGNFDTPESILGPALLKTRRAFDDNKRGRNENNLKAGKIKTSVLGKRAPMGDPRLFHRKVMPGKRDYFVVIMMDISGSTAGINIKIMKEAVMAQAHLLQRTGINFAIYAHSGCVHSVANQATDLSVYIIKDTDQVWDKKSQEALSMIGPDAINLDGHALEYGRKKIDGINVTDKIILYYSDGKMPAANADEELEILQREIKYCRSRGITLLGVGIRTDSPRRHGLETVQLDHVGETEKVIDQLRKHLTARRATK